MARRRPHRRARQGSPTPGPPHATPTLSPRPRTPRLGRTPSRHRHLRRRRHRRRHRRDWSDEGGSSAAARQPGSVGGGLSVCVRDRCVCGLGNGEYVCANDLLLSTAGRYARSGLKQLSQADGTLLSVVLTSLSVSLQPPANSAHGARSTFITDTLFIYLRSESRCDCVGRQ